MELVTYNVNGVRAAIKKGLIDWIDDHNFDVICLQETKSQPEQVDLSELEKQGFHAYWHSAEKKGYSGVLTLSKIKADYVQEGIGKKMFDTEGRVLRTDFGDWTLLNCYFPSGSASEERHEFKIKFLKALKPWVGKLLKERPNVIVVGDYNVVHLDIDIHNPTRKDKPSGFRPKERAWMDRWFKGDFKDAFRAINPDREGDFSWWSFRAGSRQRNKGWRIDYQSVSNPIADKVIAAKHLNEAKHSDHCPVWVEYDL